MYVKAHAICDNKECARRPDNLLIQAEEPTYNGWFSVVISNEGKATATIQQFHIDAAKQGHFTVCCIDCLSKLLFKICAGIWEQKAGDILQTKHGLIWKEGVDNG